MFRCKECGKEFDDWHALGGHMRTHWGRKGKEAEKAEGGEKEEELLGRALGRLSELSPQEAWQIVVNWIIDVYRKEQMREEIVRSYRLRVEESETRIEAIQAKLKKLQDDVTGRGLQGKMDL